MSTADRACPDYPNECVHPWAHARTYAEVIATQEGRMPAPPRRQPAYDAVYAVIRKYPVTGLDGAMGNARVWRAVEAALDAMEPAAHLLPLLRLTADEVEALRLAAAKYRAIDTRVPALNSALDKLTTTEETPDA